MSNYLAIILFLKHMSHAIAIQCMILTLLKQSKKTQQPRTKYKNSCWQLIRIIWAQAMNNFRFRIH